MRDLTLVIPHYMNTGMLLEQQKIWQDYPEDLRGRLHVVVVDDCSPKGHRPSHKAVFVSGLASFRILRLEKHIRWNWLACRNLGAKVATTEWLLLTDIDHGLPAETLRRLTEGPLDATCAYRFSRVDAPHPWPYTLADCTSYKPHNDTWLLTRDLFFSEGVGGYDERLSGCYGTSGEFSDRVRDTVRATVQLPNVVIRYPREIIPDASTPPTLYTRKGDRKNDADLENRKEDRACEACRKDRRAKQCRHWAPLHGRIPHIQVYPV